MMTFPIYGKMKLMFQTTNQYKVVYIHRLSILQIHQEWLAAEHHGVKHQIFATVLEGSNIPIDFPHPY